MRTLYDGMSFEAIREAVSYTDGSFTTNYSSGIVRGGDAVSGTNGSRYAWIDDAVSGRGSTDADGYRLGAMRYTGSQAALYAKGERVGMNRTGSTGSTVIRVIDEESGATRSSVVGATSGGSAYFGIDLLGSVRSATDEYGSLEERYEYDAFGKPYKGDFTTGLNAGYTGKPYDPVTGLYDYGYRDYAPEVARFTTVDPIKDGENWFAYVNNDPVNYLDPWGLRPLTPEERALHQAAGGSTVDYDPIDVQNRMPTVDEMKEAAAKAGVANPYTDEQIQDLIDSHSAFSLPGTVYVPEEARGGDEDEREALIAHETEHQAQYQNGESPGDVLQELINEAGMPDPYNTPGTLENQAQQVEDRANEILDTKTGCGY